ncbi:Very-long-chain enoyl-CoA reductase [Collichthys lucidus]|uniref:Very-long-chain enoyl-CoA reductase n=1 Tax=Collichthys lucidus TaxID=240159 RepID=A0A4U5VIE4_COLLU|nr:Very-long-chain enoyl-CoA reductase [Collichthys lucidus]
MASKENLKSNWQTVLPQTVYERRTCTLSFGSNSFIKVKVLDAKTKEQLCFLDKRVSGSKILPNVCQARGHQHPSEEQSSTLFHCDQLLLGLRPKSVCAMPEEKSLRDDEILQNLPVGTSATMYFRDLGPQLGWTMVFLAECIGPLLTYLLFYFRVPYIYSDRHAFTSSPHPVVKLACACHTFHYMKRLIETIFVHRFSHGTMPLRTIVRMCELGNFSIHLTLNNLRGDVALYTLLGFIQMTIWAKGKHRAYSREFKDYPSLRMAIIPLIL